MRNTIHRCHSVAAGAFLMCFVMLDKPITASASENATYTFNVKWYGDCATYTEVNLLEDTIIHKLRCSDEEFQHEMFISKVVKKEGSYEGVLLINEESPSISSDKINVSIRVDNGTVKTEQWFNVGDGKAAATILQNLTILWMDSLLVEMLSGKQLTFQIGNTEGNLPLDGFPDAFNDYSLRIAQLKK